MSGIQRALETVILKLATIVCGYLSSYVQGTIDYNENVAFYYVVLVVVIVPSVSAVLPCCTPRRLLNITVVCNLLATIWAIVIRFLAMPEGFEWWLEDETWFTFGAVGGITMIYLVAWKFLGRALSFIAVVACSVTVGSSYKRWFQSASACATLVSEKGIDQGLIDCGVNADDGIWNAIGTFVMILGPISVIACICFVITKHLAKRWNKNHCPVFRTLISNVLILLAVNVGMYSVSVLHVMAVTEQSDILQTLESTFDENTTNSEVIDSLLYGNNTLDLAKEVGTALTPLVSALAVTFLIVSLLCTQKAKTSAQPRGLSAQGVRPPKVVQQIAREQAEMEEEEYEEEYSYDVARV